VEYLLAHAYYHWPMYDEGFKKALLIIEMAVKLKAKELGLSLKTEPNKKGKVFDHKLVDIINEVFVGEHYQFLKNDIDRARSIRNTQMHPDKNSFCGVIGNIPGNLQLFVNVINAIFKDEHWHKNQLETNRLVKEKLESFKETLLVMENNQPGILIDQILDFKIINNKLYLFLNPVRNNIEDILTHHYSLYPEVICLVQHNVSDHELNGLSSEGHDVRIYKTDKPENITIHEKYLSQIEIGGENDWEMLVGMLKQNTSWEMVRLAYELLEEKIELITTNTEQTKEFN
jgi:hypothetical protein